MSARASFKCTTCGYPVLIPECQVLDDDDVLTCHGCGRAFGPCVEVQALLIERTKAQIDNAMMKAFGTKPAWN